MPTNKDITLRNNYSSTYDPYRFSNTSHMYLDWVRIMGGMESLLLTTVCKDTVEALCAGIRPPASEPLLPWTSHFLSTSCSTTTTEAGAGSEVRPENISSSLFTAAACSPILQPMATGRVQGIPKVR